jgi:polyisoprenoid-binding protein YceI
MILSDTAVLDDRPIREDGAIRDDTADTGLATGRWWVHAAGSRLLLDARVCGMVGVRGRFTEVAGRVDIAPDPVDSRLHIQVLAASLTTGNAGRDALLTAAGLIDPDAGPVLHFRSRTLSRGSGQASWRVDGLLSTARGDRPLTLALSTACVAGAEIRIDATGRIGRDDIAYLPARPGTARLLGPVAELDLTVTLRRDR